MYIYYTFVSLRELTENFTVYGILSLAYNQLEGEEVKNMKASFVTLIGKHFTDTLSEPHKKVN